MVEVVALVFGAGALEFVLWELFDFVSGVLYLDGCLLAGWSLVEVRVGLAGCFRSVERASGSVEGRSARCNGRERVESL